MKIPIWRKILMIIAVIFGFITLPFFGYPWYKVIPYSFILSFVVFFCTSPRFARFVKKDMAESRSIQRAHDRAYARKMGRMKAHRDYHRFDSVYKGVWGKKK